MAGIRRLYIDAASIIPAAIPKNKVFIFGVIGFLNKKTKDEPKQVSTKIMLTPKAVIPTLVIRPSRNFVCRNYYIAIFFLCNLFESVFSDKFIFLQKESPD